LRVLLGPDMSKARPRPCWGVDLIRLQGPQHVAIYGVYFSVLSLSGEACSEARLRTVWRCFPSWAVVFRQSRAGSGYDGSDQDLIRGAATDDRTVLPGHDAGGNTTTTGVRAGSAMKSSCLQSGAQRNAALREPTGKLPPGHEKYLKNVRGVTTSQS